MYVPCVMLNFLWGGGGGTKFLGWEIPGFHDLCINPCKNSIIMRQFPYSDLQVQLYFELQISMSVSSIFVTPMPCVLTPVVPIHVPVILGS